MENKHLKQYQKIEENFFEFLNSKLSNELLFYCVTGSLARESIIAEWSDIDILIVFIEYNEKVFETLSAALKNNKSNIKIGTTFYSIDEFIAKNIFKDPKTICSLELINSGIYNPRKCKKHIFNNIKKIVDLNFSSWSSVISFAMILHEYKRALLSYENIDEKKVYKLLNTLLKILLMQKGLKVLSYEDVLNEAKGSLEGFDFKIELPQKILKNKEDVNMRKKEYIKILNWLKNTNMHNFNNKNHNNKTVIGFNTGHHGGCAIINNGKIVSISEERLNRKTIYEYEYY